MIVLFAFVAGFVVGVILMAREADRAIDEGFDEAERRLGLRQ